MKVRELVKKFDELLTKYEKAVGERDELKARMASLEQGGERKQDGPQQTAEPPDWKKTEEELIGKIKVLEKHKAGLQDKCIALDKERKAAVEKLQEMESKMQGEMHTLMNITREDIPK